MNAKPMRALTLGIALAVFTSAAAATEGDPARGKRIVKRCTVCHALAAGKKKIGPSLFALVGRKAGAQGNYRYSKAVKAAGAKGLTWTEANIAGYVPKPKKFLAGYLNKASVANKMPPQRMKPNQLSDLIAYLKTLK